MLAPTNTFTKAIVHLNYLRTYLLTTSFTTAQALKKLSQFIQSANEAKADFCQNSDLDWDESEEAVLAASDFCAQDKVFLVHVITRLAKQQSYAYYIEPLGELENLKRYVSTLVPAGPADNCKPKNTLAITAMVPKFTQDESSALSQCASKLEPLQVSNLLSSLQTQDADLMPIVFGKDSISTKTSTAVKSREISSPSRD